MHDEEGAEGDAEEEGGVDDDGHGVSAEDEHTADVDPVEGLLVHQEEPGVGEEGDGTTEAWRIRLIPQFTRSYLA